VEEQSPIFTDQLAPYGKHRFQLEEFTWNHFPNHAIIRLPGLIGKGLKKNFIFDMLHNPNAIPLTHDKSRYQFYSLDTLWEDIQRVLTNKIKLVNFATPPLSVQKIAKECFGTKLSNQSSQPPAVYDVRTRFARIFNLKGHYIWTPEMEIESIREFIKSESKTK
jgi:dTDP-4-dehydrorhamnose reductase